MSLNPKGKVPALQIDGAVLTETVAILTYLNGRYPDSSVMPPADGAIESARQLADLCYCSSTLHPNVGRIRFYTAFTDTEECAPSVYRQAVNMMKPYFQLVEDRLRDRNWRYGDQWSAMDAYLYWAYFRVPGAGFPGGEFPAYSAHAGRMKILSAVQRMIAKDAAAWQQLESEGLLYLPPEPAI